MDVRTGSVARALGPRWLAFVTALAAVVVVSPSAAQSLRDSSNVAVFKYLTTPVWQSGRRLHGLHQSYDTHPLYNAGGPTASVSDPNSPRATGGGSLGYNQNLYNY